MFSVFDQLAEQRIQQAMERGEFDNLPCAGRPLDLNDDPLIPAEYRMAYHILKNAGYVPPEVEARREIAQLIESLPALEDAERGPALKKLQLLRMRLAESRRGLRLDDGYAERVVSRLSGDSGSASGDTSSGS